MESLYIEELKASINLLMANLESLPVSKGSMDSKYGLQKLKRYNHRCVSSSFHGFLGGIFVTWIELTISSVLYSVSSTIYLHAHWCLGCWPNLKNEHQHFYQAMYVTYSSVFASVTLISIYWWWDIIDSRYWLDIFILQNFPLSQTNFF